MAKTQNRLLAALVLSLTAVISSEAQEPSEILWLDAEHTKAYVIPASMFAPFDWSDPLAVDLSSLPFSEGELARFRERLALKLQKAEKGDKGALQVCDQQPISDSFGFGPTPGSKTLPGLVQDSEVSLTGRVVDLTPTWNPAVSTPYTRIFLQVDEVLKDSTEELTAGHIVSFFSGYGHMVFGEIRICLEPPAGVFMPRRGDRVLLIGWHNPANRMIITGKATFEVRNGKVMTHDHAILSSRMPVPLSSLKEDLRRQIPEKD